MSVKYVSHLLMHLRFYDTKAAVQLPLCFDLGFQLLRLGFIRFLFWLPEREEGMGTRDTCEK